MALHSVASMSLLLPAHVNVAGFWNWPCACKAAVLPQHHHTVDMDLWCTLLTQVVISHVSTAVWCYWWATSVVGSAGWFPLWIVTKQAEAISVVNSELHPSICCMFSGMPLRTCKLKKATSEQICFIGSKNGSKKMTASNQIRFIGSGPSSKKFILRWPCAVDRMLKSNYELLR